MKNAIFLLCLSAGLSLPGFAQDLTIPVGEQGISGLSMPAKGTAMTKVRSDFGDPSVAHPARGEPPITRWEYENFVVYFESETVIHSVLRHKPKAQYQKPTENENKTDTGE